LSRCDLNKCEARCCYDGVYLTPDDEIRIKSAIGLCADFFSFLPIFPIVESSWRDHGSGMKTSTRPWDYVSPDFPPHFSKTRCVFAISDGRCSLQIFAIQRGEHPWSYKPTACWMHPLRLGSGGLVPPSISQDNDPDSYDDYPGYVTYTPCARLSNDAPWREVFREEIEYYELKISDK